MKNVLSAGLCVIIAGVILAGCAEKTADAGEGVAPSGVGGSYESSEIVENEGENSENAENFDNIEGELLIKIDVADNVVVLEEFEEGCSIFENITYSLGYEQLREDVFNFTVEFLKAFNADDDESLKSLITEEFYNKIINFKRENPNYKEMKFDILTDEYFDLMNANGWTIPVENYSIISFIGKINVPTDSYADYYMQFYILKTSDKTHRIGDEIVLSKKLSVTGIAEDLDYYGINVAYTIIYDENGEFLMCGFGPTYDA